MTILRWDNIATKSATDIIQTIVFTIIALEIRFWI